MTEGPAVLLTRVSHARGQAMTVLRWENLRTKCKTLNWKDLRIRG
jgi:hypothetical protein